MNRIFVFATVVVVTLAMGMGAAIAPVAAQAQENATDSADDRADDELEDGAAENETAVEANDDFMQEIDTNTRITDWSYSPGMFTLTIEADEPTKISMTEAGTFEEGTGTFNYEEVSLDEGTNTITFAVTARQGPDGAGAGVAIATARSLEQGGGAYVSTGMVEQNPFRHFGGESGLFTGVGMTVGLAALGAWYVVRSEESGVMEA